MLIEYGEWGKWNIFDYHMKLGKHHHVSLGQEETLSPPFSPEGLNVCLMSQSLICSTWLLFPWSFLLAGLCCLHIPISLPLPRPFLISKINRNMPLPTLSSEMCAHVYFHSWDFIKLVQQHQHISSQTMEKTIEKLIMKIQIQKSHILIIIPIGE